MSAEPNMVYKKNLSDAYWRFSPPQTPIMKYIGNRTSSKNTKNKMRSREINVPAIPVCNTNIKMKNDGKNKRKKKKKENQRNDRNKEQNEKKKNNVKTIMITTTIIATI
jgi:hypothetical protein